MEELNDKQRRFVQEYLVDYNATQAAIRAGYSPKTANVIACENLTKPNIQRAVEERSEQLCKAVGATTHRVLVGLLRESEDTENTGAVRVSALTTLAKYLGMLTSRVEHSGHVDGSPTVIRRVAVYKDEESNKWIEENMETAERYELRPQEPCGSLEDASINGSGSVTSAGGNTA